LVYFFETRSLYVAQDGFKIEIFLPQSPQCHDSHLVIHARVLLKKELSSIPPDFQRPFETLIKMKTLWGREQYWGLYSGAW
jgi:hypothetical protein